MLDAIPAWLVLEAHVDPFTSEGSACPERVCSMQAVPLGLGPALNQWTRHGHPSRPVKALAWLIRIGSEAPGRLVLAGQDDLTGQISDWRVFRAQSMSTLLGVRISPRFLWMLGLLSRRPIRLPQRSWRRLEPAGGALD